MRALLVLTLLLLTGCASTEYGAWYSQGFLGYRLGDSGGLDSCSNENSGVRLGYERRLAENWKIAGEYEHVSHLLCGRPFNESVDEYTDHVGIVITYGGLK